VLPCLGNHEKGSLAYFDVFSLPNNERWYAFSYGCARVVVLDGTTDFAPGSPQHSWLLGEMVSPDYAAAAWHLAVIHQPPFTASGHSDDRAVQQYLVPLFEEHGVDMVFSGHSHCYERYRNNGVVYIVTGGGGAPLYPLKDDHAPPIREAGAAVHHHVVIDLTPASAHLSARDNSGAEIDGVEIGSTEPVPPPPPPAPDPTPGATLAISGRVTDEESNGLEGVRIELKGCSGLKRKAEATTDASGRYTFTDLSEGVYLLKPSLKKWSFTPATRDVTLPAPGTRAPADFRGTRK
jgi:hypothetical protein